MIESHRKEHSSRTQVLWLFSSFTIRLYIQTITNCFLSARCFKLHCIHYLIEYPVKMVLHYYFILIIEKKWSLNSKSPLWVTFKRTMELRFFNPDNLKLCPHSYPLNSLLFGPSSYVIQCLSSWSQGCSWVFCPTGF